jgi:transcriptional regulator with XRE-family HTH domain
MRAEWREPSDPEVLGRSTIGRAVRQYRLGNSWSQRQLAWLVGVHQSTVARLEHGTLSGMRLSTLARILGQLSVPPDALLLQQGPPPPTRRLPDAGGPISSDTRLAGTGGAINDDTDAS